MATGGGGNQEIHIWDLKTGERRKARGRLKARRQRAACLGVGFSAVGGIAGETAMRGEQRGRSNMLYAASDTHN